MAGIDFECQAILKIVDTTVSKQLNTILESFTRRPNAKHFNEPVNFPGYLDVIKQPMDLGTVQKHLFRDKDFPYEEKRYQWVEQFAHDVRLVCTLAEMIVYGRTCRSLR